MSDVFTDLDAETEALAAFVDRHGHGAAPDVTTHLARLTTTARLLRLSVETPASFGVASLTSFDSLDEAVVGWLIEQRKANALLASSAPDEALPWRDGPLRPSVLGAAALTELFAGGQDIADVFGVRLRRDDSIGHVAYFGVRTRDRAYGRHALTPPEEPFRFVLTAPSGTVWTFGPETADQRITGPAEDFCLAVTRRRPPGPALEAAGAAAAEWLDLLAA
jgi:uncharacterized protein (TIGR03084 family)